MEEPAPATPSRRLQKWRRIKYRLRLPIPAISFARTSGSRSSASTNTVVADENTNIVVADEKEADSERVPSYYSTTVLDDPFARGPLIFLPRHGTGSAPTLLNIAISTKEKPLPRLPSSVTSTSSEEQLESASPRSSSCSDRTYHTCWEGGSTKIGNEHIEPPPLPVPPLPVPRRSRISIHTLEYLLETTDDEDDGPHPPGAYRSTAFFGRTAAQDIHPLSLDPAQAASDRRSATSASLRRASSSPILPPSKRHSRKKEAAVRAAGGSKGARLPTYDSSRVPSYK